MSDLALPNLAMTMMLVVVFGIVVLVVMAVAPMFAGKVDMRQRLSTTAVTIEGNPGKSGSQTLVHDDSRSMWARLVQQVEKRGLSLTDTKGDALAEKLMLAGYTQSYAVRAFVLIKTTLTLVLPLLALLVMYTVGMPPATKLYMIVVGSAAAGLYIPNMVVSSKAAQRKKEILNGFPDTLDLMLVCVEAGLGIDASFSRVGSEIVTSHPLLSELLANVSLELRAGRTREVALKNLARRTALPELTAFVTLLNQSAKLGSSVGQALKIYAAEMREARRMRAEEKAARLPVLLSVPLVLFLLPTMVSVLMLPAIINVKANLAGVARDNK